MSEFIFGMVDRCAGDFLFFAALGWLLDRRDTALELGTLGAVALVLALAPFATGGDKSLIG